MVLQEGELFLLEESLVKLSREQSVSLADVRLWQRPGEPSSRLDGSSALTEEGEEHSSFRGMVGGWAWAWGGGSQGLGGSH